MGQTRKPEAGDIYRHFKDKLYEIITVAIHSETEEEMVVYRQMYGNLDTYVRPLSMFLSEVDHNKYPEVKQKYRFEKIGALRLEEDETDSVRKLTMTPKEEHVKRVLEKITISKEEIVLDKVEKHAKTSETILEATEVIDVNRTETLKEESEVSAELHETENAEGEMTPAIKVLMDFLDARTYGEKLKILDEINCELDHKIINNMAISMDIVIDEGTIEERLAELHECIHTKARYECFRLN